MAEPPPFDVSQLDDQFPPVTLKTYKEFASSFLKRQDVNIKAHTFIKEQKPDHDYFQRVNAKQVEEIVTEFRKIALLPFDKTEGASGEMTILKELIEDIGSVEYPDTISVLVIGDQGIGKSSAVNRLIQPTGDICAAAGGSTSVTSCPTTLKFDDLTVNDSTPYRVRVNFLDSEDVEKACEKHAANIDSYHAFCEDTDGDASVIQDYAHLKDQAQAWAESLHAAFGSDDSKKTLTGMTAIQKITSANACLTEPHQFTQTCTAWFNSSIQTLMGGAGGSRAAGNVPRYQELVFGSIKEMQCGLEEFTAGRFKVVVKSIDIFLNATILATGLELVDLPGLRDTNSVRNDITNQFLSQGHIRLVCARASRIETEELVHKQLRDSVAGVGVGSTYLVVLRIDEEADTAEVDRTIRNEPEQPFPRIQTLIGDATKEIEKLSAQSEDTAMDVDDIDDMDIESDQNSTEISNLRKYISYLELEAKAALVKKRCLAIAEKMWQKYYDPTDNDSIKVYFLCAQHFEVACKGYTFSQRPFLSVKQSGVPTLRRDLLATTGESRLLALQQHVDLHILSSWKHMDRICFRSGDEKDIDKIKEIRERTFSNWLANLQEHMIQLFKPTSQKTEKNFILSLGKNPEDQLRTYAHGWAFAGDGPGKIHRQTYEATAKRSGFYSKKVTTGKKDGTPNQKSSNNAEKNNKTVYAWANTLHPFFTSAARSFRLNSLHALSQARDELLNDLQEMDSTVRNELKSLEVHLQNKRRAEQDWRGIFRGARGEIERAFYRAEEDLKQALRDQNLQVEETKPTAGAIGAVLQSTLSGFQAHFYVQQGGKGRWKAKAIHKQGMHQNMQDYIENLVGSRTFIDDVFMRYKNAAETNTNNLTNKIAGGLHKYEKLWIRQSSAMKPIAEEPSPQNDTIRAELRKSVPLLQNVLNELGRSVLIKDELAPSIPPTDVEIRSFLVSMHNGQYNDDAIWENNATITNGFEYLKQNREARKPFVPDDPQVESLQSALKEEWMSTSAGHFDVTWLRGFYELWMQSTEEESNNSLATKPSSPTPTHSVASTSTMDVDETADTNGRGHGQRADESDWENRLE